MYKYQLKRNGAVNLRETIIKLRSILTRREKIQVVVLLVAIILMAIMQAIGVASVLPFISLVMNPDLVFENKWLMWVYETFNFTSVRRFTVFAGIVMFALIVLSNGVSALATWFKLRFAWMNNHRVSRRLLEKYLSLPYSYFLNQNSADLSKNVLTEVNHLTNDYIIPLLTIISRTMIFICILAMLFFVDVYVSIAALIILGGAYGLIFLRIKQSLKRRGLTRMSINKQRFKLVNEAFGGIKEIKVLNREPFFLGRYSKESFKYARLMSWNAVIGQLPRFVLEAIAFGSIIIFVLVLLLTREDVSQVIPLVSLFAFAGYKLMPALQEIFTSFTKMQFNQAVLDRVYNDFRRDAEIISVTSIPEGGITEKLDFNSTIELNNIKYYYPGSSIPVIKDVNIIINKNSAVAFVGLTGAGKTTLADLILGLLKPVKGSLKIDGLVIDNSNLAKWQSNIGYVPQQIFLADDTIANNIAFGIPEAEVDFIAVENAARIANIHDFIVKELPKGYNTLVGERGIRLSGGQRQRIGIARALYSNPDVLVFDEATSALDGITEEAVLSAMESAAAQKTLIIIAHRFTTVKESDVIYVMDNGRVSATGTYNELITTNEHFKAMAKLGVSE